ncbi:MAG: FAD-dependent oxidoreductase [Gemmatimonadota bacterium]
MPLAGSARAKDAKPAVAILGAGFGGLTAANDLSRRGVPVRVFEAGKEIAGLSRSFRDDRGFTYDFGAHFITNRLAAALGVSDRCYTITSFGETVFLRGKTYSFPLGLLRSPSFVLSAVGGRLDPQKPPVESAADWYRREYGRRLADEVALPLVEAWSGVPPEELAPSVVPPQVDRGTLHVLKLKLASRMSGRAVANGFSREKPENAHVWHVYPNGGVVELCERLAMGLDDCIALDSRVEAIMVERERVVGVRVKGVEHAASAVVSTAPLHVLPKLMEGTTALDYLAGFRYRPMVLVNLRFNDRPALPDVTTWVPERQYPFFRLTEPPQSIPWLAPAGMTMVTADIGCEVDSPVWAMGEDELGELCIDRLDDIIPSARARYQGCRVLKTPVGYPVYLRAYEAARRDLESGLPVEGLISIGRNGEFAHILTEDIFWRTLARMRELRVWLDNQPLREHSVDRPA